MRCSTFLFMQILARLSSFNLYCTAAGSGDWKGFSPDCTAMIIFLSDSKSSLHFSSACKSFFLFSSVDNSSSSILFPLALGGCLCCLCRSSNPISRATNPGGVVVLSDELNAFGRRISDGSIGLLGVVISHVNLFVSILSKFWFPSLSTGEESFCSSSTRALAFAEFGTAPFSFFLPEIVGRETIKILLQKIKQNNYNLECRRQLMF